MQLIDFSGAKIGDKIWDAVYQEWVIICDIYLYDLYPLKLSNDLIATLNGLDYKGEKLSRYYWDEIKFGVPPPPKRISYKKIEGVIAIEISSLLNGNRCAMTSSFWTDKKPLDYFLGNPTWQVVTLSLEVEVKE